MALSYSSSAAPPSSSSSSLPSQLHSGGGLGPRRPLPPPPDDPSTYTFHAPPSSFLQQQQQHNTAYSPSPFPSDTFIPSGHSASQPLSTSIPASSPPPPPFPPLLHTSSISAPPAFPSPLHHRHASVAPNLPSPHHTLAANPNPAPHQRSAPSWRSDAASAARARGGCDEESRPFCMADPWRRSFTSPAAAYGVGGRGGAYGGNAPLERGLFHPVFDFCNSDDQYSSPFISAFNSHRDIFSADQFSPLMKYNRFLAAHSPTAMGALASGGGGGGYCDDLENLLCASSSARMVGKSQSMRALYEENAALRRALYSIRSGSGGGAGFPVDSQAEFGSTDRRIASDGAEGRAMSMREGGRWAAKDCGHHHCPLMAAASQPQWPSHATGPPFCAASNGDLHLNGSGGAPVQQLHQLFSREAEERRKAAMGEKSGVQCAMCGEELVPPPPPGSRASQSLPLRLCSACQPASAPGGPAAASARHRLAAAISIACRPSAAGKGSAAQKRPKPRFLDLCRHFVGFSAAK